MTVSRASAVVFGVLLVLNLALPAFHHDLWNPDEPRIAHLAQDMVRHGNVLIPEVNGEVVFEQPPLQAWMTALCMLVFGAGFDRDWVPRLPSIAFGLGVLILVARTAYRLRGPGCAVLSCVLLTTCIEFTVGFHRGIVDTGLTFFVTLAMLQIHAAVARNEALSWKEAVILGAAGGLSFLAKNLIGPVFIWLVLVAVVLRHRSIFLDRRSLRRLGVAVLVGLAVSAPYVAAAALSAPADLDALEVLLVDNTIGRFVRDDIHNPPFFEFAHRMLGVLMPWIAVALVFHIRAFRRWWRREGDAMDRSTEVLFWWTILPMLLVQCSGSKREIYLLPVTPAIALATAVWIDMHVDKRLVGRVALVVVAILAPLAPAACVVGGIWAGSLPHEVWIILVAHLVVVYVFVRRRKWTSNPARLSGAAFLLLTTVGIGQLIYYRAENGRQSYVQLCRDLAAVRDEGVRIVLYRLPLRERSAIPYYLEEHLPDLHEETDLDAVFADGAPPSVVVLRDPVPQSIEDETARQYRVRRTIHVVFNSLAASRIRDDRPAEAESQ